MSDRIYETWRIVNLVLAATGPVLLWFRKVRYDFHQLPLDMIFASMALLIWPVGYFAATLTAMLGDVEPGPWTCIMWVPLSWTFVSAVVRRENKENP